MKNLYLFLLSLLILIPVNLLFSQPAVNIPITVSDDNGFFKNMAVGLDLSATNGIDPLLGESDLSPFPPAGIFEARFDLTPYAGTPLNTYKDYRNPGTFPFTGTKQHRLIWQLSFGADTLLIAYNMPIYAILQIQDDGGGVIINSPPLSGSGIYRITIPVTSLRLNVTYTNALHLLLSSPNGGETWASGEQHNITWEQSYTALLNILWSTNSGNSWNTAASNVPSGGRSYTWTVPNTPSQLCRIKIQDAADSNSYDISDNDFIISDTSLIAYYTFSGNASDQTGHGYNGSVNGASLSSDRFGNPGNAYSFDGVNDYIDLQNTEVLNFTNKNFTLVAWMNFTQNKEMCILNKNVYGQLNGYGLQISPAPKAGFYIHMDPLKGVASAESYNDGKWHLVTGTYQDSVMKLYVDGVLKGTAVNNYTQFNNTPIRIGKFTSNPDPAYCFSGRLDDILIYNRALSLPEIQALYTELPGVPIRSFPVDGSINTAPAVSFTWHKAVKTERYRLQVSADSLFGSILYEDSLIYDTVKSVSVLSVSSKYFWRVGALNYAYSTWSDTGYFFTNINAPVLTSLSAGGGQITLDWTQSPLINVSYFKIFRDTVPSASILLTSVGAGETSYTDTLFPANVICYYRIKAVSVYGYESAFSNELSGLPSATFQLSVNVVNNWNMVSIPGLLPYNQNTSSWWIGKDPAASVFKFAGNYQVVTSAVPGTGYWMKHTGVRTYNTGDEWPAAGIALVPHNPVAGTAGWNLIGGYEQTVPAAGLTTTPPGLISGSVYKYAGVYQTAAALEPGYGYWIKLTGAGQINIPAPGPFKEAALPVTEDPGKIIITDAAGKSFTLYTLSGDADPVQYDLPPYPPLGTFDIRFSSQRCGERLSSPKVIELSGVRYPVKLKVEKTNIILIDETGKEIGRLKAGEEISLAAITGKLTVTENVIPFVYSLEQNYPNPFNPTTTISYSIPEYGDVIIKIFDILGTEISTLVYEEKPAGIYKLTWNASSLPSGVYFCQMRAGSFIDTRKMILLK